MPLRTAFLAAFAVPLSAISVEAAAPTRSPPGMDYPREQIQADLGKLLNCRRWYDAVPNPILCNSRSSVISIRLTFTADQKLETVEMEALAASEPPRPEAEQTSRESVKKIFEYFLPMWPGEEWIRDSLNLIAERDAFNLVQVPYLVWSDDSQHSGYVDKDVEVERFTVLARWRRYVDTPDRSATIVITRHSSIAPWIPRDGVASDGFPLPSESK